METDAPRPASTQRRLAAAAAVVSLLVVGWGIAWWWLGDFRAPTDGVPPAAAAPYFAWAVALPAAIAFGPFAWWRRDGFMTAARWGGGLLVAYGTVTILVGGFVWYAPGCLLMLAGSRAFSDWLGRRGDMPE